jgi:hypothetical protein
MNWSALAFLLIVLSFPALGIEQPTLWGQAVNGFSVGLSVSNTVSSFGQPLFATVSVRNDSDAQQWLTITPFEVLTSFIATDENRRQVEVKRRDVESPSAPGSRSLPLSPGGVWSDTVNLHDFLILTNSGDFVVTAKRSIRPNSFGLSENVLLRLTGESSSTGKTSTILTSAATSHVAFSNFNTGAVSARGRSSSPNPPGANAAPAVQHEPVAPASSFTLAQKMGTGIVAGLAALILLILWHAARRKPQT